MGRRCILLVFVVAIVCFLSGCNRRRTSHTSSPPPPDLTFCELIATPSIYEGKLVRLHASFVFGLHGPTVGDRKCSSVDTITWVNLSPEKWAELERPGGAFDLVAVGKFSRNAPSGASDLWKDRAPFQFEVLSIEKTTPHF